MKKYNITPKYAVLIFLILFLLLTYLIISLYGFRTREEIDDHARRWRESSYLKQGTNPFDIILGNKAPDEEIGAMPRYSGYFPWSMAIGIITSFTMFDENVARILLLFLGFIMIISVFIITFLYCRKKELLDFDKSLLCALCCVTLPTMIVAFSWSNVGLVMGFLLFIFVFLEEKHPIIAGLILGITTVKPMLALPFIFATLIKRNWKCVLFSFIVPFIAQIYAVAVTKTPPFLMINQMFVDGISYETSAIINAMTYFTESIYMIVFPHNLSNFLSAIICISLALVMWYYLKDCNNRLVYYSIPALLSTLWMYSPKHDHSVLSIFVLCIFISLYKDQHTKPWKKFMVIGLLSTNIYSVYVVGAFRQLINPNVSYYYVHYAMNFFQLCTLIYIVFKTVENQKNLDVLK